MAHENLHVKHVSSFIESQLASAVDLSDCKPGEDKTAKLLSRGIVALSLVHLADSPLARATDDITDGLNDNGLDAVSVSSNRRELYLVQGKWNDSGEKTLQVGDLHKYLQGCRDLVGCRWDKFNDKVRAKKQAIEEALVDSTVKIFLVLTFPSTNGISSDCQSLLDDYLRENNNPTETFFLRVVGLAGLKSVVTSLSHGKLSDVSAQLFDWGLTDEPFPAVYGQIACSDVAAWYERDSRKLFTPNIRFFLGNTDVNARMVRTLTANPEVFWYMNNGITALCDSYDKLPQGGADRKAGVFTLKNLRIVNGAQTVGAIHQAWRQASAQVEKAKVSIKIVTTQRSPLDFETEITTNTNTQNRIEPKDFAALDPNQARLKSELQARGYYYAYRAGESTGNQLSGIEFQEAAVAMACRHDDIVLSVLAKRNIGALLDKESKEYKLLFSSSLHGTDIIDSVLALRKMDTELMALRSDSPARTQQLIVHGNRVMSHLLFKMYKRAQSTDSLDSYVTSKMPTLVDDCMSFIEKKYPDAYLAVFFKNSDKCRELAAHILGEASVFQLRLDHIV